MRSSTSILRQARVSRGRLDALAHTPAAPKTATTSIIWLHGLGDSSAGFSDVFEPSSQLLHLPTDTCRIVIPDAPVRSITINGNAQMRAWYDIVSMDGRDDSLGTREDAAGINASCEMIHAIIDEEVAIVGSAGRVLLGGFSQGAAMSVYAGLRYPGGVLAGICSCSGYVLQPNTYMTGAPVVTDANRAVPMFMYTGTHDPMVPIAYARAGHALLAGKCRLANVQFTEEPLLQHSLSAKEIVALDTFIHTHLISPAAAAASASASS